MEIPFEKENKSPNAGLEIPNVKECMPFAFNITSNITFNIAKYIVVINFFNQVGGVGDLLTSYEVVMCNKYFISR